MTFSEVETITTRLPSWTGGVDPDRAKRVSGDGVVEIPRFAQDDRDPDCRQSTTPPRQIRFAHLSRHPSCPGVSSRYRAKRVSGRGVFDGEKSAF